MKTDTSANIDQADIDDSDDEIIMSGLKDKSLTRINIMTMNDSFKNTESSFKSHNTSSKMSSRSKGKNERFKEF